MSGYLLVGLDERGKNVVVNHPDIRTDRDGIGHIVFSPAQARNLARLMNEKADEIEPRRVGGWYADDVYVCGPDAGGRPGGEVLAKCEPTLGGLFDRDTGRKIAKKIVSAVNAVDGLRAALQSGVELVGSAFAHVSHGGPTRADAEAWLKRAEGALK